MTDYSPKQLRYLLAQVKKRPCTRKNEIYQLVLETALLKGNQDQFKHELSILSRAYGTDEPGA